MSTFCHCDTNEPFCTCTPTTIDNNTIDSDIAEPDDSAVPFDPFHDHHGAARVGTVA